MGNLFAWASIGENGKSTGGRKGDQTGREVKIGDYYNFGQNWVVRCKSLIKRRKIAKCAKALALNENIGYNQNERCTSFLEGKRLGWDANKINEIQPCNTDCSELYVCAVNFAFGKEMLPSSMNTRMIPLIVGKYPKWFEFADDSINTRKFCKGDAVGKTGHVIINI